MFAIKETRSGAYIWRDASVATSENPQGWRNTPEAERAERFETREEAEMSVAMLRRQFAALKLEIVEI